MGNLHSVAKAFASQGADISVTDDRKKLASSKLLVLPGVGSFGAAMKNLAKKRLDDFIRGWVQEKKAYVGICLGLQLLFERSEEDKGVEGLGVLRGPVVRFRPKDFRREDYRIPHMGWNQAVRIRKNPSPLFAGIDPKDFFYFVHTYYPVPQEKRVVATTTDYGTTFCSSVWKENIFASQFHPEKSGSVGLKLIRNILKGVLKI